MELRKGIRSAFLAGGKGQVVDGKNQFFIEFDVKLPHSQSGQVNVLQ